MSDLSIVTVTYQSATKITEFINATQAAAPDAEIVVVDNASTDDTRQLIRAADADVQLVCSSENVGFGRGCNLGVAHARGNSLIFVNPDVRLKEVVLPRELEDDAFGLGVGLIATGGDGTPLAGVRAETTQAEDWIQEVWKLFVPKPLSRYLNARRWPARWPVGGMFIARRDEYERIGGFDPRYFLFFEDRDLGARYREQGLPLRIVDGFIGSHQTGSSSTGVASWQREAWSIISWLEYLAVWRDAGQAASTASRVLTVLSGMARLSLRPGLSDRVRSKAYRAGLTASFITKFDDFLPVEDPGYYICAREAISSAKASIAT